ncbi:hypothetical protein E2562_007807 [Oryza meyeriana var. granulata]|uniref:Uncharacterized protein n=1 Tax=Oryza meyeriana var. granulata TaxID=110450 RepID=A0A6G1F509_9ORYZ|nr:hypothetical protein E2562_007807 [Oryza meyeriana var. granulata]
MGLRRIGAAWWCAGGHYTEMVTLLPCLTSVLRSHFDADQAYLLHKSVLQSLDWWTGNDGLAGSSCWRGLVSRSANSGSDDDAKFKWDIDGEAEISSAPALRNADAPGLSTRPS